MRLLAISDLHLGNPANRAALAAIPDHGADWLILAGDIAERVEHMAAGFALLARRFARLVWVPGNHDLWCIARGGEMARRGEARYRELVALARAHGALTPEDPWPVWPGGITGGGMTPAPVIAPLFLLYDYSLRPEGVPLERVRAWAREQRTGCADEYLLHPDPHPSRAAWCAARCAEAEARLTEATAARGSILINHWPLRRDLVHLPRIPRFLPWCGTVRTHDWHRRFNARVAVSGHLHTRRTDWRDGTRFEEVSLGYPHQWDRRRGIAAYLREVLPGPPAPGRGPV